MAIRVTPKAQSEIDPKLIRDYVNSAISDYGRCYKVTRRGDQHLSVWIHWHSDRSSIVEALINEDHAKCVLRWIAKNRVVKRGV